MAEVGGPSRLRVLWPQSLAAPSDEAFSLEAAIHESLSHRQAVVTVVPCSSSSSSTAAGWPPAAAAARELSIPVAAGGSTDGSSGALQLTVVPTSAGLLLPVPSPSSQGCAEAEVVLYDPTAATPSPAPAGGGGGGGGALPAALASRVAAAAAGWALGSLSRRTDALGIAYALAGAVEAQLSWFMTAQPLGEEEGLCHKQLSSSAPKRYYSSQAHP